MLSCDKDMERLFFVPLKLYRIPGVGYVASAVHAAKGNTEQAKRAMGRSLC